jgi:outer membrane protein OmpA-like peptidoglycan-associated protein
VVSPLYRTFRNEVEEMNRVFRNFAVLTCTVAASGLGLTGCAQMTQTERGAVIGAGTGAAVGGVIGRQTGSTARGAIIGAVIGGAAGAVIGRQMDQQAAGLEDDLEGANVERMGEGIAVTFASGILFPFDSEQVLPAGRENLRNLAQSLQRYPETEVLIVGHTDSVGRHAYNMDLSRRRAASARAFLVQQGVPAHRIRIEGRGPDEPIATNETEAGRQQNRRVEIAIFASEQYRQRILQEYGN